MEVCNLFNKIPKEKLDYLFKNTTASAELDFTFLAFEEPYKNVINLVSEDTIIIDLGCAYACQSYYFEDYKKYIGIDYGISSEYGEKSTYDDYLNRVIKTDNSKFYFESIQSFIKNTLPTLGYDLNNVFAICSAVPDKEARNLMKKTFPNYLDWYPGEKMEIKANSNIIKDAYVSTYWGVRHHYMPLADYLDTKAYQCMDFMNYKEMLESGYSLDIPTLYNKDGELLSEEVSDIFKNKYSKKELEGELNYEL